jgi:hypothetical protein
LKELRIRIAWYIEIKSIVINLFSIRYLSILTDIQLLVTFHTLDISWNQKWSRFAFCYNISRAWSHIHWHICFRMKHSNPDQFFLLINRVSFSQQLLCISFIVRLWLDARQCLKMLDRLQLYNFTRLLRFKIVYPPFIKTILKFNMYWSRSKSLFTRCFMTIPISSWQKHLLLSLKIHLSSPLILIILL